MWKGVHILAARANGFAATRCSMVRSIRFPVFMREQPLAAVALLCLEIIFRKFRCVTDAAIANFKVARGLRAAVDYLMPDAIAGFEADAITLS